MAERGPLSSTWLMLRKRPRLLTLSGLGLLAIIVAVHLQISGPSLAQGFDNLLVILAEAWPPDFSVLTNRASWANPPCNFESDVLCSPAVIGLVQTLEIAFLATLFGMVLSLPLATMAAHNLSPAWLSSAMRSLLAAFRVLPSLIWALLFVIIVGIGPLAGVLAMTLYTIGYLGKLQYEALEGVGRQPLEAARAMGLSRAQVARYFAIPEASNSLLSQLLFMFEYNVRHGSVVGLVGAGGIGWYMQYYLAPFRLYDRVLALLLVLYVTVVIIDAVSLRLRRRFIESDEQLRRPTWRGVFLPWKSD
ncbi:MAG: phosphonate ABC transporter, permease protein PhnE [Candidatus Poseidoniales archaeon]|nr:phosphonate ABC transporter, permease protein PhnE [Candidatus Poseidoniales archaeon]